MSDRERGNRGLMIERQELVETGRRHMGAGLHTLSPHIFSIISHALSPPSSHFFFYLLSVYYFIKTKIDFMKLILIIIIIELNVKCDLNDKLRSTMLI